MPLPPLPRDPRSVRADDRATIVWALRRAAGAGQDAADDLADRRRCAEVTEVISWRPQDDRIAAYEYARDALACAHAAVMDAAARVLFEAARLAAQAFFDGVPDAPAEVRAAAKLLATTRYVPGPGRGRVLVAVADALVPRVLPARSKITTPRGIVVDVALQMRPRRGAAVCTEAAVRLAAAKLALAHRPDIELRAHSLCTEWGYSPGEVCAALGISAATLKARARRSRLHDFE